MLAVLHASLSTEFGVMGKSVRLGFCVAIHASVFLLNTLWCIYAVFSPSDLHLSSIIDISLASSCTSTVRMTHSRPPATVIF
jgi:hypothetical protein